MSRSGSEAQNGCIVAITANSRQSAFGPEASTLGVLYSAQKPPLSAFPAWPMTAEEKNHGILSI